MSYTVAGFYKFVPLEDYREMHQPLLATCRKLEVTGTILLADEGINGTVAGSRTNIEALIVHLQKNPRLAEFPVNISIATENPFNRLKIRLKKEIIKMGVPGVKPSNKTGRHVTPEEWNSLVEDQQVLVLDARNKYETAIGSFANAVDPRIKSFVEITNYVQEKLGEQKDRKIAMFCTGGIRCEKLSTYMMDQGFKEVYQLRGGILRYLQEMPEEKSLWNGECFIFDHRVSLGHGLKEGSHTMCHGCGHPVSLKDRQANEYEMGVSCPMCAETLGQVKRANLRERQKQVELASRRNASHIGQTLNNAEEKSD